MHRTPRSSRGLNAIIAQAVFVVLAAVSVLWNSLAWQSILHGGSAAGSAEGAALPWMVPGALLGIVTLIGVPWYPLLGYLVYVVLFHGVLDGDAGARWLRDTWLQELVLGLTLTGWIGWSVRSGKGSWGPRTISAWAFFACLLGMIVSARGARVVLSDADAAMIQSLAQYCVAIFWGLFALRFVDLPRDMLALGTTLGLTLIVRGLVLSDTVGPRGDFGMLLLASMPLVGLALTWSQGWAGKLTTSLSLGLLVYLLLRTGERGAVVGVATCVVALAITLRKRWVVLVMSVALAIAGGGFMVVPQCREWFVITWRNAADCLSISGSMPGSYGVIQAELGLPGLILVVLPILLCLSEAWRLTAFQGNPWLRQFGQTVVVALVGCLVGGWFFAGESLDLPCVLCGASLTWSRMGRLYRQQTAAALSASGPAQRHVVVATFLERARRMFRGEDASLAMAKPAPRSGWPGRTHLAVVALAFTLFTVYGSLLPFNANDLTWRTALERFPEVVRSSASSVSDWAANTVLFIPLGFLWLGAISLDRPRRAAVFAATILVPLLTTLSLSIEFTQLWFPSRTSSQYDVLANSLGSIVGAALWWWFGPRMVRDLRRASAARCLPRPFEWLLLVYLAGLALYSLAPLDVTISPGELYHKFKSGRILLTPFVHKYDSAATAFFHFGAGVLLCVPVGALAAILFRKKQEDVRPLAMAFSFGLALVTIIKSAQVFVYSREADLTDIPVGAIGVAIGAILMNWLVAGSSGLRILRSAGGHPSRVRSRCAASPGSSMRIAGLDGLRALACLAVFGVHLQQMTALTGSAGPIELQRLLANGNTGVCLLFILSGAVLSLPLWRKDFSQLRWGWLKEYFGRRLVRIAPAYYVCLMALVLLRRHWHGLDEVLDTLLHAVFLQNYREATFYSIAPPFWTIAVQMQFYLLLPLVFWWLSSCSPVRPRRELLLLAIVLGSYLAHYLLMENGLVLENWLGSPGFFAERPTIFSHSVLAHLPHLLLGVLAGRYLADQDQPSKWLVDNPRWIYDALVWGILLSIGVILGSGLDDLLQAPHGRYHLPFVPMLIALLIVCVPRSSTAIWVFTKTRLSLLGGISYGVYVYHYPLMRFTAHAMDKFRMPATTYWYLFAAASLSITVLVSWLSFRFLEEPLLRQVRPSK